MSLAELQMYGDETELKTRLTNIINEFVGSFRQAVAYGFELGPVTLQNQDLNRVHSIVTEIDSRRAFYNFHEDELPKFVLQSIYEVRNEIKNHAKGVWANPTCEVIIQEITQALNDFTTQVEKFNLEMLSMGDKDWPKFTRLLSDLRLRIWSLIAYLQKKLGNVLRPKHLPLDIHKQVVQSELE